MLFLFLFIEAFAASNAVQEQPRLFITPFVLAWFVFFGLAMFLNFVKEKLPIEKKRFLSKFVPAFTSAVAVTLFGLNIFFPIGKIGLFFIAGLVTAEWLRVNAEFGFSKKEILLWSALSGVLNEIVTVLMVLILFGIFTLENVVIAKPLLDFVASFSLISFWFERILNLVIGAVLGLAGGVVILKIRKEVVKPTKVSVEEKLVYEKKSALERFIDNSPFTLEQFLTFYILGIITFISHFPVVFISPGTFTTADIINYTLGIGIALLFFVGSLAWLLLTARKQITLKTFNKPIKWVLLLLAIIATIIISTPTLKTFPDTAIIYVSFGPVLIMLAIAFIIFYRGFPKWYPAALAEREKPKELRKIPKFPESTANAFLLMFIVMTAMTFFAYNFSTAGNALLEPCYSLTDTTEKDNCIKNIAIASHDYRLCYEIKDESINSVRFDCLIEVHK